MDEFFAPFVKKIDFIMGKGGIDVEMTSGEFHSIPIKLVALTADNPAKSAATGTAGHTAKVNHSLILKYLITLYIQLLHSLCNYRRHAPSAPLKDAS